ncbi:MAG: AmmeMemoRadiSam system radical SAM enzyme [Thermoplasmata archaeon]|nr:MAG: AmmeMemoRadiSam system radical SAM enzyme [Thermoplasmata archaeon]
MLCSANQCNLCYRKCIIKEGKAGYCKTRINIDGKIYTLTYGNLSAIEMRPMEIKPFFHFYPGSYALTFSTYSCNFRCPWCQNWHISMQKPPEKYMYIPPKKLVEMAGEHGLCASFNEPTLLFEYCIDVFKLSNKPKSIVSNGYMTKEALKMLYKAGLDAMNIDIKGDEKVYEKYLNAEEKHVWEIASYAKKLGIHVEIINLIITEINDKEEQIDEIIEKHLKYVGSSTPIHFTRYFPAYKFNAPPTSIKKLEYAYERAKKEGILYPYIGNVAGHKYENTYCHKCGKLLIKRHGSKIIKNNLKEARCPFCKEELPFIMKKT